MDTADERTGVFDKALVAGISCLVLWTWLHYEGGCYSLRSFDMTTANVRWLAHSGVAAMASLTVCALALRSRRGHPREPHRGMRFVGSLCALLGTAAALVPALVGTGEELAVLALASGVLTGIGQGLLLCLFCSLTSHLGTRASLAHIVAALAISATLMVACHFLPDYIGRAIGLVCPLICLAASAEALGSRVIPARNSDGGGVALPLMAVSYLLLPFPAYGFVGPGIHALGYQYFFVLLWPLLGSPRLRHRLPALATIGGGLGAVQAGQAVGSALWICAFAGGGTSADPMALTLASDVSMLLALLLAVMFERPAFAWAEMRPGKQADVGSSPNYEQLMGLVGARYDLSPREVEVLALIGRGHTRQNVADTLGISLQTAKTHVARIYHQLDVHSQQEMLDVLETCREEYGTQADR